MFLKWQSEKLNFITYLNIFLYPLVVVWVTHMTLKVHYNFPSSIFFNLKSITDVKNVSLQFAGKKTFQ